MTCLNINDPSVKAVIDYYGGNYITAAAVVESWQKANNTDAIPMISDLEISAFNRNKNVTSDSYSSIKGIPIIDTEDIISYEGTKGAAQYDRKNNQVKVNRKFLKQKFEEKAWTKPRKLIETLHGNIVESYAQALPENQFSTYQEWENFVINHEYQHSLYSRQDFDKQFPNKTKGDYESEINKRALNTKQSFESRELKMERFKNLPEEYVADRTVVGKEALINTLNKLKSKFGIDYVIDPTLESKGAFKNGKVYINPNKFTLDTPFHEYAHPFLMYVKQKNPTLYNQLAEEIKKDSLLMGVIKKTYSDKSESEQIDEAIVTKLGKLASNLSSSPQYKSILDKIFDFISSAISRLTGKTVKIGLNTTLHDLASMLVDETRVPVEFIDFEEGTFESRESDFNEARDYFKNRDLGNLYVHLQELEAKGVNTLLARDTLSKLHKIASRVEKNEYPSSTEEGRYTVNGDSTFKGVTDWIEDFAPEGSIKIFKGDPSESPGVKYGNSVDFLLDIITQSYNYKPNYKLEDYENLDDLSQEIEENFGVELSVPEIKFLTSQILKIFEQYPNHVFLSQMSVYNSTEKVVGTTDLLAIDPETGAVNIIDLKLSARSVSADSKKLNRYKYQVSTYGAIYKSRNVPVNNLSLYEIQRYDSGDKKFGYGKFVDISPLKDVEQKFNVYNDVNENKQNKKLINKIKVILEKELRKAKRNKNAYGVKKYTDLKTALSNISVGESVNNFIKSTYLDIIGKPYVQNGVHKISTKYSDKGKFETLQEQYKNKQIDDKQYIEELFKMKKDLELYEPILFELLAISKDLDREDDSTSRELRDSIADIIQFKREFINEYKETVIPSIANELVKNLDLNALAEKNNKSLQILQNRLAKYKAGNASESTIKKVEDEIKQLQDSTPNYERVVKQLEEGFDKDLSYFQTSLIDTISSHNDIISLYVLKVKAYYENINQEIFKSQPEFDNQYDKFSKLRGTAGSDSQIYGGMFEKTIFSSDGGWNEESHMEDYGFVRDRKYGDWMKSFAELNKKSDELEDRDQVKRLREQWYLNNCESLPQTSKTYFNKALNKDVVLEYGVDYLLEEVKKDFLLKSGQDVEKAERDYNDWLKNRMVTKPDGSVIITDIRFVKPVKSIYNNTKYEALERSSQFEYYNFLLSTVLGSRVSTSNRYNIDYRLPSVPATMLTKLKDSGIKTTFIDGVKSFTQATPEEQIEYGDSLFIGDPFQNKLEDKDRTFNLTEVAKMFYKESLVRKTRRDLEMFSLGLLDVVGETEVQRTKGGKTIWDRAKMALKEEGLDINPADIISGKQSNIYKVLDELIETLIYGRTRESGNEKLMQVVNTLAKLAATTQIGGLNVIPAIAQNLQQSAMAAIEAWAGTNLTKQSLAWARTQEGAIIADLTNDLIGDGTKKSKIGQLLQSYNVFQGDFFDQFGRKLNGQNVANMLQSNPTFFLQKFANEMPLIRTFLAYLKDNTVDVNGVPTSLWDAYELDGSKRLTVKPGTKLKNYGDFSSDIVDGAAMKKFHSIVKGMGESKGLINNFLIKRKWYGKALTFYRNWVSPGVKKRFDTLRYDKEKEDYVVGSYNMFWKKMWAKDFKAIVQAIGKNKGELTDYEYAALRHAFFEQSAILLTSVMGAILASMLEGAGDDDDKKQLQYMLYFTQRLNAEMSFFGGLGNVDTLGLPNVGDTLRMFKQPTFLSSYVMNSAKLMYQLTSPFEKYERDYGMFEKGDSKLYAKFLKLFGVSGTQMHPEDLLKILTLSTAS